MPTTQPVALKDRVEFASDAWLAEAERYLRDRVGQASGGLEDARWVASAVFTDAPAHLGWPKDRAAFRISVDRTTVEVAKGELDDVDRKDTADYHMALAVITTVAGDEPAALERARREFAHRHGPDAWVTKGELDPTPAVRQIFSDLHDHMARRTISDADVEDRIARLGLATN